MLYERYPELNVCKEEIQKAVGLMIETYKNGGKILICGCGGSAADSEHMVGELMKEFMLKRPVRDNRLPEHLKNRLQGALPAISLPSQCAILSAYINDADPEMMYAQLVYGYIEKNDLLIGISTSGNSKMIANAMEVACCLGVKTLAITGEKESKISEISDITIHAPERETYKVQEYHLPIYHYLCAEVERYFWGEKDEDMPYPKV